jgi:sugar/nucleoside kinase (ribokinase family)
VLCAVGDLVEDIVVWLAGPPGEGTDTDAQVFRRRGGSAANVAALCATNGTPARFVGQVGADALGDRLLATLSASGVDVQVRRGGRTGTIVVLVAPGGERTMLTDRGAALDLALIDTRWLDGVQVLHLPAYSLTDGALAETSAALAQRAKAAGATVSVDASSVAVLRRYGTERFLALVADLRPDVLLANDDEQRLLGLCDRAPEGVGLLVVHRGRGAATAADAAGIVANVSPERLRDAADTTGAGDAFAAGFLPAFERRLSIDDALAAGHACAARTLDVPGASTEGPR